MKVIDGTRMDLPVSSLEPNKFNPNVMSPEAKESLKEDMKRLGPKHDLRIDDIVVCPKNVFYNNPEFPSDRYVIIDGEHRWTNAVELEWPTIPCEIRTLGEDIAKAYNFRKNRERGQLDPVKEAELFNSEKLKQDQIARKYNVTRSYVASRLSLIQLDEKVKEMQQKPEEAFKKTKIAEFNEKHEEWEEAKSENADSESYRWYREEPEEPSEEELVPRGTLSASHLEAIASLPKEDQIKIADTVLDSGLTVRDTEDRVKRIKAEIAKQKRFQKALEEAKRPKCPNCGSDPKGFSYQGERLFTCSNAGCYNTWDYMKTRAEVEAEKEKHQTKADKDRTDKMKKGRENPRFIRMPETPEELNALTAPWILQKALQLTEISSINVTGKRGDEEVLLQYSPVGTWTHMDLTFHVKKGKTEQRFGFNVQPKDYKKFKAKSRVDMNMTPSDETREQLAKFFREIVKTNKDPWEQ